MRSRPGPIPIPGAPRVVNTSVLDNTAKGGTIVTVSSQFVDPTRKS